MNTLYMLIGIPGSGKSTLAHKLSKSGCKIISSDAIREELGCVADMSRNKEVFSILKDRLKETSKTDDVVIDCTNTRKSSRQDILKDIDCQKVALFLNKDLGHCKLYNQLRDRVVPVSVLEGMFDNLEPPSYDEGFDEIITYNNFYIL